MDAIRLKTDYLTKPLGLGNPAPRFYWNCQGSNTQTAYQIRCTRAGEEIWDSGKVKSNSMTHIPYCGEPLRSRDTVQWSVTLWDETDTPGKAAESSFEMGLLEGSDWKAHWITGDYKPKKDKRYGVDCFRKRFSISKKIAKAQLYASARGLYDVTVNGERIEDITKPDRSPKKAGELPRKLQRHTENTSIARYVWLPIQWDGDKPVLRWQASWRLEDCTTP